MEYSVKSIKGEREYMEDRYAYMTDNDITIAMIADGHGGSKVANNTCYYLPKLLFETLNKNYLSNSHLALAIRKCILDWGYTQSVETSGCTLTGIATKNGVMYVYNIGDSRTCISLANTCVYKLSPQYNSQGEYIDNVHIDYVNIKNLFCTLDHEPALASEKTRITNAGGHVTMNDGPRLNGILSIGRALGDAGVGPGLSFVPDIYWFRIPKKMGPVVMYSDGIYEMARYGKEMQFTPELIYNIASTDGADDLVDYALANGSSDNLTVLTTF